MAIVFRSGTNWVEPEDYRNMKSSNAIKILCLLLVIQKTVVKKPTI